MLKSRSISRRLHVHPDTALLTRICHVQGRELLSCAEASANRSISIVSRPARHLGTFNPNVGATDRRAALHCFCMKKNASGAKGERERGGAGQWRTQQKDRGYGTVRRPNRRFKSAPPCSVLAARISPDLTNCMPNRAHTLHVLVPIQQATA